VQIVDFRKYVRIDQTNDLEIIENKDYVEKTRGVSANSQRTESDPLHPASGRIKSFDPSLN